MTRQLWKGTLAELSAKDYFAVGAQAYFRDSQTRQEFSDYDPGMIHTVWWVLLYNYNYF